MINPRQSSFRVIASAGIVVLLLVSAAPGRAQITVFDPSNYAQNVLTAARSLEQVTNQITGLQNQAQMLINQARQLTSLPTSMLGEIESNFSQMQGLLRQAEGLAYDVQSIDQQFQNSYQRFGSDQTSRELVDGARQRWQTSLSAFEHSLKIGAGAVEALPQTQAQTGALVAASQSAVGNLQATQAGNQLLAVQARQLSDLTAVVAAQGRSQALEQARQAAAQEQAREQFRRFMTGTTYQPSTVRMFQN